ncbi:ervatamin-B-like [Dioscorea cayenensis subsp. rotundata]|uniref:Ervatamin-B-like n=1 Tax=Dioscorea cayennensis subsp. rotundata TaxID=55577 RepID=A0AB40D298_DIOCR|nr:ervatamin-B-like [Dioscorea cayenensis subsp. rotundata]
MARDIGLRNGVSGSCWAFAALAVVEGAFKISTGRLISLSAQQLVNYDRMSHGCCGGSRVSAFKYIGVISEDNYLHIRTQGCWQEWKVRTLVAYISDFQHVPTNEEALVKVVAHQLVMK